MKKTTIDIHLDRIKEIRQEMEQKEEKLSKSVQDIIEILEPKLKILPKINCHGSRPLKKGVIEAIEHLLSEANPKETEQIINLGRARGNRIVDAEKLCQKLNPVLAKVGLIAMSNKNFIMNGAINIYKIS